MSLYENELEQLVTRLTESLINRLGFKDDETVNVEDDDGFLCLRCGCRIYSSLPNQFEWCPTCGRKVVEVEE